MGSFIASETEEAEKDRKAHVNDSLAKTERKDRSSNDGLRVQKKMKSRRCGGQGGLSDRLSRTACGWIHP